MIFVKKTLDRLLDIVSYHLKFCLFLFDIECNDPKIKWFDQYRSISTTVVRPQLKVSYQFYQRALWDYFADRDLEKIPAGYFAMRRPWRLLGTSSVIAHPLVSWGWGPLAQASLRVYNYVSRAHVKVRMTDFLRNFSCQVYLFSEGMAGFCKKSAEWKSLKKYFF